MLPNGKSKKSPRQLLYNTLMQIKSYNEAIRFLENFIGKIRFRIDPEFLKHHDPLTRMRVLLRLIGNPERKFPSVLVGGTAGKGSTAYLISHILTTAGYKTGLTLSPHLQKVNERLQINEEQISDEVFVKMLNLVVSSIEKMKRMSALLRPASLGFAGQVGAPSYFEILIAMAFKYFAEAKVDIAVVEVGMGGEFDATNTLYPLVSVLTNVSLDHTNVLGGTVQKIAKTKAGIIKKSKINPSTSLRVKNQKSKIDKKSLEEKVKFLGQAYALGVKAYEEDENAKKEIEKINKQIYEQDSAIMPLYQKGREWSLEYFETIYKRLGTKFDYYYFESQVGNIGLNLVNEHLKKGVFVKSNGAVIFSGEKYGLHNRVFINSLGIPTYEAKDLGLAPTKYKDFSYDLSIIVTAQEQSDYFKVVLKALSKIAPKLAQKTKHIAHGVVRLPMGKMSSRTGTVITGEWLLDEAKRRIQKEYKEMDQETAEKVAVGAVKYALLKSGIGRDIAFGFEESINLEGNSGPYLQYTYARTQSVLAKINPSTSLRARNQKSKIKISFARGRLVKLEGEEVSLMRGLSKFPEIVEQAGEKFAPNLLCNYLFDLSQKFNLFYQKIPILHPGVNVTHPRGVIGSRKFRLALTMAVGQVIKNGLYILGIESPGKM